MIWDNAADQLLIKLWDEGGSLSYVAAGMQKLGYNVTRNAIAGRRHRLPRAAFDRPMFTPPMTTINPEKPPAMKPVQVKLTVVPPTPPIVRQRDGYDYMHAPEDGCKALLDRRGKDGLPMVCGKLRGLDYNGAASVYCEAHFRLHHYPPENRSHHHGKGSKVGRN